MVGQARSAVNEAPPSCDQLRAFAMRHGGKLIMQYAKEDNTCWNDMQFGGSARCRRIQSK